MTSSQGRRVVSALLLALATVLVLPHVGFDAPDRGRGPYADAAAVSRGVASDHVDPAVLPQKFTPLVSVAGEHRAPKAITLLVAALLAAVLALGVSAAGHTRPVAKGTPPLARRRNCIGLRAPPSLQLA